MGLSGVEPLTSRLSGVRSNHLSYRPPWDLRGDDRVVTRTFRATAPQHRRQPRLQDSPVLLYAVLDGLRADPDGAEMAVHLANHGAKYPRWREMMAKAPVEAVELPRMTDPASIKACYQAIGDAGAAGRLPTAQAFALNRGDEGWVKADEAEK